MKTSMKLSLGVLALSLGLGLTACGQKEQAVIENKTFTTPSESAATSSSSSSSSSSNESTVQATPQTAAYEFSKIKIDAGYKDVIIQNGASNNISYSGDDVTVKDGVLTIVGAKLSGFSIGDGDDDATDTIVITTTGQLELADISTDDGDIDVKGVQIGSLNINTVSGDTEVDQSQFTNLAIAAKKGDISLGALTLGGDSSATTDSGDVDLYGITGVGINANGRQGSFVADVANGKGTLTITAPRGDIEQEVDD
jgi:uncharacterized lipoprotein YehR (DUF1307 family)